MVGQGGNYWVVSPIGAVTDGNAMAARHFYKGELDVDEITRSEAEALALNVAGKPLAKICAAIRSSGGCLTSTASGIDRARIHAAFETLRDEGFDARMDWGRCQSSGWEALPKPLAGVAPRIVFFSQQDAAAFDGDGNIKEVLYLSHVAGAHSAYRIVEVLNENGLRASWDSNLERRIEVMSAKPPPQFYPLPE